MRSSLVVLLLLSAVIALSAEARAQEVRFIPQVGLFANAQEGPDFDPGIFLDNGGTDRSAVAALGLVVEVDLPLGLPVAARVGGIYAFESDVPVTGIVCIESPCVVAPTSMLAGSADLVLSLRGVPLVRPYLLGGVGLKRWLVDENVSPGAILGDPTRFAGHLGAGVALDLGPVGATLEVSDYLDGGGDLAGPDIGRPGDTRHDVFVMLGVSLRR